MDTIGGFRLVRRLGSGARADVHLGHATTSADGSSPRAAAIKMFRPTTPITSIDDEIEALARLSSPFLLPLRDLAIAEDGRPVLVLERLGPMTCSRLILERQRLSAGEAVTILAPLGDAVDELGRVGVVHGRIRLDRIGFDDIGTPVLFGFGHARVTSPFPDGVGHAVESTGSDLRVDEDTEALAAVTRSVLETTRSSHRSAELLDWIAEPFEDPARFRAELRDRLFELADPEAIVLTAPRRVPGAAPSGTPRPDAADDDDREPMIAADWVAAMHLPDWMLDLLPAGRRSDVGALAGRASSALRRFLAPVRRPVWIAAGSVTALLVAALVATGTGDADEARAESADRSVVDAPRSPAESPPADSGRADAAASQVGGTDPDDVDAAITGDDVVLAATALLHGRSACIEDLSILCLDGIDQQNSAALEADAALIRALQEGATEQPIDLAPAVPTIVEELGGTVILSLSLPAPEVGTPIPASLLVVHGEDGWRIRDLVIG